MLAAAASLVLLLDRAELRSLKMVAGRRTEVGGATLLGSVLINLLQESQESRFNVRVCESGCLREENALLVGKGLRLVGRDLSCIAPFLVEDVQFVANEHNGDVRISLLLHILDPLFAILKTTALTDVVNDKRPDGSAVVAGVRWLTRR